MATAYKSANLVDAGVGLLYVAPIGTTEPTDASGTLDTAWREVGYTEAGATITTETTYEAIEVAEELEPIRYEPTARTTTLAFEMAQATAKNLGLALNKGANVSDTIASLGPPALGADVSVMLCLNTEQGARWLFYSGKNSGALEIQRVKNGKTLIPASFNIEKVTGKDHFTVFPGPNGFV